MAEKVIVLESLPAAGKTTLANRLRDEYGFVKVNESLGSFDPAAAHNDQQTVYREWVARYALAREANGNVVIDRGYPTLLAWDHCAEVLGVEEYYGQYIEKAAWVAHGLEEGEIFEPDLYVYLRSNPKLSVRRRPRPATPSDVWSEEVGMEACTDYYEGFFGRPDIAPITLELDAALATEGLVRAIRAAA